MDKRWDEATEKLVQLTEFGEITWKAVDDVPCWHGNDARLRGRAYLTTVQNRRIAVYEYEFRYYTDADEWHWETEVAIAFVDASYQPEWIWPSPRARWKLLDVIRYRMAKADRFFEEFLTRPKAS